MDHKNLVVYDNDEDNGAMLSQVRLKVLTQNGRVNACDDGITVTGADEAKLVLTAATSYNGFEKLPGKEGKGDSSICTRHLENASKKMKR